jgi:hypothetical protein
LEDVALLLLCGVCAPHERCRACRKLFKKFKSANKTSEKQLWRCENFPEGVSPLCARVTLRSISKSQGG